MAGDFTGDGHLDLAVANYDSRQRVGPAGQRRRHVPAPGHLRGRVDPHGIVAGDFTGDGRLDLAVAQTPADQHGIGAAGQRRRHVPAPGHLSRSGTDASRPSWRATSPATATSTWPS